MDDITSKAEAGDMEAQYQLGQNYCRGSGGLERNFKTGFDWFLKSAEQGHLMAQNHVGNAYIRGVEGVDKDATKGMEWLLKSAKDGCSESQFQAGFMYFQGNDVEQDFKEALKWWIEAGKLGHIDSQFGLGQAYSGKIDIGIEPDPNSAFEWYLKAAQSNHMPSMVQVAGLYKDGMGVEKNTDEAAKWFIKAAEHKEADANLHYLMGLMYSQGDCLPRDNEESLKYLMKAASKGHLQAHAAVGGCFEEKNDYPQALEYFKKAAEGGEVLSAAHLAELYQIGAENVPQNDAECIKWMEIAAKGGHAQSQCSLAVFYATGTMGVQRDTDKARYFLLQSAAQEFPHSMYVLGDWYSRGFIVGQNGKIAAEYYRKGAEMGHAAAQYKLSCLYSSGFGVEKNVENKVRFLRESAEQGYPDALFHIGMCYSCGLGGVSVNVAMGLKYVMRAAAQGHDSAMKMCPTHQPEKILEGLEHCHCCASCGKRAQDVEGGALQFCARCHSQPYCSVSCQKEAWKKHKPECSQLKKLLESLQFVTKGKEKDF